MKESLVESLKIESDKLDTEGTPRFGLSIAESDMDLLSSELEVHVYRDVNTTIGQRMFCGKPAYLGDKTQWITDQEMFNTLNTRSLN